MMWMVCCMDEDDWCMNCEKLFKNRDNAQTEFDRLKEILKNHFENCDCDDEGTDYSFDDGHGIIAGLRLVPIEVEDEKSTNMDALLKDIQTLASNTVDNITEEDINEVFAYLAHRTGDEIIGIVYDRYIKGMQIKEIASKMSSSTYFIADFIKTGKNVILKRIKENKQYKSLGIEDYHDYSPRALAWLTRAPGPLKNYGDITEEQKEVCKIVAKMLYPKE